MRVVVRYSTGVLNSSLTSKAILTQSLASWLSVGSMTGTLANLPNWRLSCSFCELCCPGSSAVTMTNPPLMPEYESVKSGSAATLRPTCFIAASERAPATAAPMATSTATFSLGAHSL